MVQNKCKTLLFPVKEPSVAVIREHFSAYGQLSAVELEDVVSSDSVASKCCSAYISVTTCSSAEMAFASGKCWKGHNLQFMWLSSSNSRNVSGVRDNPPAASEVL
ncbi:hypothetical protein U1Q18_038323 [Sarracenia purpurea var. burkii]